ncbi:hypothetical protein [Flavobacterium sp. ZS1P14]
MHKSHTSAKDKIKSIERNRIQLLSLLCP